MIRKNLPTLIRTGKNKSEDCVNIADRRINEKPPSLVGTEEEKQS